MVSKIIQESLCNSIFGIDMTRLLRRHFDIIVKEWQEEELSGDEEIRKLKLLISRTGTARDAEWHAIC
jgi:hypothetical protein